MIGITLQFVLLIETSSNFDISYSTKILLQFAHATVALVDENQSTDLCLLFDSGSQFAYIAPAGKNKLLLTY